MFKQEEKEDIYLVVFINNDTFAEKLVYLFDTNTIIHYCINHFSLKLVFRI